MNYVLSIHLASLITLIIAIILAFKLIKYPIINMVPSLLCGISAILNVGGVWVSSGSIFIFYGSLLLGGLLFIIGFFVNLSKLFKKLIESLNYFKGL